MTQQKYDFNAKLEYSINLLRKGERLALRYNDFGYFLAFSGGKDSQALAIVRSIS